MMNEKFKIIAFFTLLISLVSCSDDPISEITSIPNTEPNILLIIADDFGVDASPGYNIGTLKPYMPNLQKLMDAGVKFENVWSNPVCSPTRASIITGKYGFRTGVVKVGDELSTSETSIQKYISQNAPTDYSNAVIGKWHLSNDALHPIDLGIDEYAGILTGAIQSYTNWTLTENNQSITSTAYSTTVLTDLAIDFVNRQEKPWFLWLAYNAPHTPFHLPPSELHYQDNLASDQTSIDNNPLPYYLAMVEAMDTEIGRLFEAIGTEELNNTTVIFIGDNGTPNQVAQDFRSSRAKGTVYQGGIQVPMVVSGAQVSRINQNEASLINATDIFATIADLLKTGITEINDSKSFKPLLSGNLTRHRDFVFSELGYTTGDSDYTVRNETHKYILFADGTEALYNLIENPLENPNLLNSNQSPLSNSDNDQYQSLSNYLNSVLN